MPNLSSPHRTGRGQVMSLDRLIAMLPIAIVVAVWITVVPVVAIMFVVNSTAVVVFSDDATGTRQQ